MYLLPATATLDGAKGTILGSIATSASVPSTHRGGRSRVGSFEALTRHCLVAKAGRKLPIRLGVGSQEERTCAEAARTALIRRL